MDKDDFYNWYCDNDLNNTELEIARDFDEECNLYYYGKDLGITYHKEKTKFRVWAPTATGLKVLIYNTENSPDAVIEEELKPDINGTWVVEIMGDLAGKYFVYHVNFNGHTNEVVDPYTRAVSTNSQRGLIVDLDKTDPPGWEDDRRIEVEKPQDAIVYEVHVKDFSSSVNSGIKNKGKYLAFTETGTVSPDGLKTGIDHLKELGITHVHLQPVFDFVTVDETREEDYNWGYDPYFYNVPEGAYATNPSDDSRIREFKEMVKSLHDNRIGVIMDVVYNHTYFTKRSPFNKLVPGYYYRFDDEGNYSNGSGTGNELASEKQMVRKFIIDSVKYWAEEYHIDGFRFDLMALHDRETMSQLEQIIHNINPSIIIYGEPWTGGVSPLAPEDQMVKGAQRGMDIAVFNDNFRNAIKGDNDGIGTGFVSGASHQVDSIKRGIVGAIYFNDHIQGFAEEPQESVNYVSSHDNLTLWDKLNKSNIHDSEEVRIKMDRMAQGIIFTSQGMPFIQGGEEFLRTKYGNHNSYNAGDKVNQLKWERKWRYYDTFEYYRGLIKLRKEHPAFRLRDAQQIRQHLRFISTPYNTLGFMLRKYAGGDHWKNIIVLYNPNRESIVFCLPYEGDWHVVADDRKTGTDILYSISQQEVQVAPISLMVLFQ